MNLSKVILLLIICLLGPVAFVQAADTVALTPGWYERYRDAPQYKIVQSQIDSASRLVLLQPDGKLGIVERKPRLSVRYLTQAAFGALALTDEKDLLVVWVCNKELKRSFVQHAEYRSDNLAKTKAIVEQARPFIDDLHYRRVICVAGSDNCRSGWLVISDSARKW